VVDACVSLAGARTLPLTITSPIDGSMHQSAHSEASDEQQLPFKKTEWILKQGPL
jgi:hypothetical protein